MMNNLFDKLGVSVFKTDLSRKMTLNNMTAPYPVYKIKIDELFYNDKNDRIATIIDKHNKENNEKLIPDNNEKYNSLIETFIVQSNEQAMIKTKNSIRLIGQREAGVVLPDGRIIDGNRRFTCLRQLANENEKFTYFEAVILPETANEKQIKLLELMIQHGEEQRVDYDPIDMIIGAYKDIVEDNLITKEEYSEATNIPIKDVDNKLKAAKSLNNYLDFLHMPKHYYLAKEFDLNSLLLNIGHSTSVESLLNRCNDKIKEDLKNIIYTSITLNAYKNLGKYIESLSKMTTSGMINTYVNCTKMYATDFKEQLDSNMPTTFAELKSIIFTNSDIKEELSKLYDESLLRHRKNAIHKKPSENVNKSIALISSIDEGVIERFSNQETEEFKENITKLSNVVNKYSNILNIPKEDFEIDKIQEPTLQNENIIKKGRTFNISIDYNIPPILIKDYIKNKEINNLIKTIEVQTEAKNIELFFINENNEKISNSTKLLTEEDNIINFELYPSASSLKECWLAVKSINAPENSISQIIHFNVKIEFSTTFNF